MKQELVMEEEQINEVAEPEMAEPVEEVETPKAKPEVEAPKVEVELQVTDLPGVGAATAEKLASVGFDSLMSIAVATPGELVNAAGVSEAVARKIINASRDGMNMGFVTGEEVLKKRDNVMKISTGAPGFDAILGVANARKTLLAGFTAVRNVGAPDFNDVSLHKAIDANSNAVTLKVMADPGFQKQLRDVGAEPVADSNPEKAARFVQSEINRWTPIIKRTGFTIN